MSEALSLLGLLSWIGAVTAFIAYVWRRASMTQFDYRWEIDFIQARKEMFRTTAKVFSTLGLIGTALLVLSKHI